MATLVWTDGGKSVNHSRNTRWTHTYTFTGTTGSVSITQALSAPAVFIGAYLNASSASGAGDLTIKHRAVDLIAGAGANFTTTAVYLPALVTASATDFADGLPVDSDLTVLIANAAPTEIGTLVLVFESYPA